MTVLRSNYSGVLDAGHKAYQDRFFDVLNSQPMLFPALFHVRGSTKGDETSLRLTDVAYIPKRDNEMGAIEEREYVEDGTVTFTHNEYVAKFIASAATWSDLPDDMKSAYPDLYAISARATMDNTAFGVLRDAFTGSTYTGPDNLSLCNDAHTLKSGDTADNKTTAALAISAINAARAAMQRFKTSKGRVQINQMARYLVVPPEKEADAKTFVGSTYYGDYSTQESDFNFANRVGLEVIVVPYLSDVNDWFLAIDPAATMHGLVFYRREDPMFDSGYNGEDKYYWGNTSMRFSVGFDNWRQIYGSSASA